MRKFLRILGVASALLLVGASLWVLVYVLVDRPQRMAMEHPVLNVIDTVREDHTAPKKVVGWLDQVADRTEVVKGDIVRAPEPEANATAPYGEPADHLGLQVLHNRAYSVGYDNDLPGPRWSSYRMFPYHEAHHDRPAAFKADARTKALVATQEFVRSGYDRGHMTPNYAIAVCYGEDAQRETFLLSNIVPQLHALNAGLWKDIEQRVAHRYVERYGVVWVQVGPIFSQPVEKKVGRLPVPKAFFMVISEYEQQEHGIRAIAYLVPHQEIWHDADLGHYVVSIREVEKQTGLDFFPHLPKATQDLLESTPAPRAW